MLQNIDKHVKKEAIKKPYGSMLDEMMLVAEENRRTFMQANEQYFVSASKKTIYNTPKIYIMVRPNQFLTQDIKSATWARDYPRKFDDEVRP